MAIVVEQARWPSNLLHILRKDDYEICLDHLPGICVNTFGCMCMCCLCVCVCVCVCEEKECVCMRHTVSFVFAAYHIKHI